MAPKTTVVKSKSSNGGVSNMRGKQKSTKSDVEFQPLSMKKRGVYVENKDDKLIDINGNYYVVHDHVITMKFKHKLF